MLETSLNSRSPKHLNHFSVDEELLKLTTGDVVHRPTSHFFAHDVEHHLAELQLGKGAKLHRHLERQRRCRRPRDMEKMLGELDMEMLGPVPVLGYGCFRKSAPDEGALLLTRILIS